MHLRYTLRVFVPLLALAASLAAVPSQATEIWSGRTFYFSKAALANPLNAANQDRITPLIWITRANTLGIYNIAQETSSSGPSGPSPVDTEWATGDASNYLSLTFAPWVVWAESNPPGTVGIDACVHLISEDIYIDIRFDAWGIGTGGGGSFAYTRGVPPNPTPIDRTSWGAIKALYR